MTTKARWLVGIAVVAGVVAVGVGFAVAGDGGTQHWPGGMTDGTSMGTGMTDPSNGSMTDGMMGTGMATMMAGVDMEAMHDRMMAAMAGMIPPDVLARCEVLHYQMWSGAATDRAEGAGHSMYHETAGSTG
jgi:hypothetical protein